MSDGGGVFCFSQRTKTRCGYFVGALSTVLFFLGILICTYGYLEMSGEEYAPTEGDFKINIQVGLALILLAGGIVTVVMALLGCLAAYYQNCCVSMPFMLIAFAVMVVLLISGAATLGDEKTVKNVVRDLCKEEVGDYGSMNDFGREVYSDIVDRLMCSAVCPCEDAAGARALWEGYGVDYIRVRGRVYTIDDMTEEELDAYEASPLTAPVIPF